MAASSSMHSSMYYSCPMAKTTHASNDHMNTYANIASQIDSTQIIGQSSPHPKLFIYLSSVMCSHISNHEILQTLHQYDLRSGAVLAASEAQSSSVDDLMEVNARLLSGGVVDDDAQELIVGRLVQWPPSQVLSLGDPSAVLSRLLALFFQYPWNVQHFARFSMQMFSCE
ncbi:hypothetical protein KC19_9G156100 [Ceratodon purpureus]|uniref:Uncharacterized protein n=1 Tax=Ceratodon purpureus TaxID=3225 RepID=A0A8T0GSB2_CERPU|nr:hypothetical protein KC19_9G156100 [Ceratodon purpureus]